MAQIHHQVVIVGGGAAGITVAAALTEVLLDAAVDVSVASGGHLALVQRVRAPASVARR